MLKIKLQPVGRKKQISFRVVVVEDRSSRDGKVIEFLGRYDQREKPLLFEVDFERIEYWQKHGAQMTETVASLVKRSKEGKFDELNKRKKVSKHKKAKEKEEKKIDADAANIKAEDKKEG